MTISLTRCKPVALALAMGTAAICETAVGFAADAAISSPSADDGTTIQEIVVTAQRRQENVDKVPMSITAISADQLRDLGIVSVGDLQKAVPDFHFTEGSYGAPIYAIRGIGFNDSATFGAKPTVAVSVDEVPLPFPVMTAGVGLDLDRVEVLKGPQGTLYGQNSTGGAINYIAAKPTDQFDAGVDVGYGNYNALNTRGFVSGRITDTLTGRLAVGFDHAYGWQQSYTRDDQLGRKDLAQWRLTLDWQPIERFKGAFTFAGYYDRSDTPAAQLTALTPLNAALFPVVAPGLVNYPTAPANDRAADWDPGVNYAQRTHLYQLAFRGDYQLNDDVTLTSLTSYSGFAMDRPQDADGTAYQNSFYDDHGRIDVTTQELRLSGKYNSRLDWVVGSNYEYDNVYQRDDNAVGYGTGRHPLDAFGGPWTYFSDYSHQRFSTASGFANATYQLTNQFDTYAGVRFTKADLNYDGCSLSGADGILGTAVGNLGNYFRSLEGLPPAPLPGPGQCVTLNAENIPALVLSKLDENNVSWRIGADWKPVDDSLIYGNISKGYKSGSYPLISSSNSNQLTPVTQESVVAYELGFKVGLSRSLKVDGAVFYDDYANKQLLGRIVVPAFGALEALVNVPKSSLLGAELQTTWVPLAGLTLSAGATYIHSQIEGNFSNYDPYGTERNFEGEAFPLTPNWQGFVDGQYKWIIARNMNAFVGAHTSSASATNGGFGDLPVLKIDAYTLLDLRAGVEPNDHTKITFWGNNVTDKYYWTNADHIADTTVRFAGMPATYGVELSYRFR